MKNQKFKIGDRVFVPPEHHLQRNSNVKEKGTVSSFLRGEVYVIYDRAPRDLGGWYFESELKLIPPLEQLAESLNES